MSKDELKALDELKKDQDIRILPADKVRIVVVLDTGEYKQKCENLLKDTATYKNLGSKDPTSKYSKELVNVLQELEKEGGINREEYRELYPTTEAPPKFYGLPKVHKINNPLRPIVSSIGTITCSCTKHLADILSPLVGKTKHHVANSQAFADCIKDERVEDDEELRSYDVTALFTSVPVDKALYVIQSRLGSDKTLCDCTRLSQKQVVKLVEVCLRCTYFVYNGTFTSKSMGRRWDLQFPPLSAIFICNI